MKQTLILALILTTLLFTAACSKQPSQICLNQETSLICKYFPDPLQADIVLRIANIQSIKNDSYTKQEALEAINHIEALVQSSITYSELLFVVNNYISNMGPEIFILTSSFSNLNQTLPISEYDRKLILIHFERQKTVINMI